MRVAECRNSADIANATTRSGQEAPVAQTAAAASTTATLPMASLRLHNQTERTLASPSRKRNSSSAAPTLTASASAPTALIVTGSGEPPWTARHKVDPATHNASV